MKQISLAIGRYDQRPDDPVTPPVTVDRAVAVIGIGQSLMAGRGGTVAQQNSGPALMAAGGAHISAFSLWSGNSEHPPHADDWSSAVAFSEGGEGQSPLSGIISTLTGYADVLLHSAAIGARRLDALQEAFFQVQAAVDRSVALLVGRGYSRSDIDVIFAIKHGEANAAAGVTQASYEQQFADYILRCRLAAARALRLPMYVAPLHLSFPVQQRASDDLAVKKALLAQADALENVYTGEVWSVPVEADRVHPTPEGYVLMGERIGRQMVLQTQPMRCINVSVTGTTFTANFNKPVIRDESFGLGTALNSANAVDGFEFWDGEAFVPINGPLTYSGSTVSGTLASAPIGGELRIAVQATTATLTNDPAQHVGCAVRSDSSPWVSPFDPSYMHYDWCIPQIVEID